MSDFFSRIGSAVTGAANKAQQTAKDLSEQSKINSELAALRNQKETLLRNMGQLVYDFIKKGGPDPDYQSIIAQMDAADLRIEELEKQLTLIKGGALCPCCNAAITAGDMFCPNCGFRVGNPQ